MPFLSTIGAGSAGGFGRRGPAPQALPTIQDLGLNANLTLDVQSFNPASSNANTRIVTNLAPAGNLTSGTWTTERSNSPTTGSANMVTVSRNGVDIDAWDFPGGNTPSTGWIHFAGGDTNTFPGGSASFSCMWWVAHDNAETDWGLGGQDGTPTWTGGGSLNTASAAINSHRVDQWEFLGHGFDHRAGGGESTVSHSEWVNYVYTVSNTEFRIYRNGLLMGSTSYAGKNTANTNFFIGRSWSKEDLAGVDGKIAWTAYWKNQLLSQAEVTSIWENTRQYFGVAHSSLRFNIPAPSSNWTGIHSFKVVVNGVDVSANLSYDTTSSDKSLASVSQNGLRSTSTYNPTTDPRGTTHHWTPDATTGFSLGMRFPYSVIGSYSDIDYIEISYHTSYENPSTSVTIEFDGHQVSYTYATVGAAVDSSQLVRYTFN